MTVSESRIRIRRKELNLTQKVLAERLGVSTAQVQQWEHGMAQPNEPQVEQLISVLDCSVDYLTGAQPLNDSAKKLGERLKQTRIQAGLSQGELAKRCGWLNGQKRVSNYENGERLPGYSEAITLSKVLNIEPAWLVFGVSEQGRANSGQSINEPAAHYLVNGMVAEPYTSEGSFVSVPFYRRAQLAELLSPSESQVPYIQLPMQLLNTVGINESCVVAVELSGHSMDPVLPEGSLTAVDLGSTEIIDGHLYLIAQGGLVRARKLQCLPTGYRLKTYSEDEYPAELVEGKDVDSLTVLGRIFWSATLR